ncbi:MAG: hypothetical protein AAF203_08165 [Pseudomonadota bacterium]
MKNLMLILVSLLMTAPAMAFDQSDLDAVATYEELAQHQDVDMEGLGLEGEVEVQNFLGRRRFRCVAENGRGLRFRGQGQNRRQARRRAMRKCRNNSFRPRSCYLVRCKRQGGRLGDLIDNIDEVEDLF